LGLVTGLWAVVKSPKDATSEIEERLKQDRFAQAELVRNRRNALAKTLLSPTYILAHLLNLLVLAALVAVVWIGPNVLLKNFDAGPLGRPLTYLERIIYVIIFAVYIMIYFVNGAWPGIKGWIAVLKATSWLKKQE
jgi:hypothetical protein